MGPFLPHRLASRVSGRTAACAIVLAAAAVLNLVQFPSIDAMPGVRFDAIHRNQTSDMVVLAHEDLYWAGDRFGLPLALRAVAPQARLIIPTPSPFDTDDELTSQNLIWLRMVHNHLRMAWVSHPDAAGILPRSGLDPVRYAVATGKGSSKGPPWIIAVDPVLGPAPMTGLEEFDELVVSGEYTVPAGTPVREFVLLRYGTVRNGSRYHYQDVLLETSLLPETIRRELAL